MRTTRLWLALALALLCASAQAGTTMWLSTDPGGTVPSQSTITVPSGSTVQLYCFLNSPDTGNTFDMMVGFDTSDASTFGFGVDTNNGATKKLTLASTKSEIEASMPASFDVLKSAVLDASGREATNVSLGGRPYGFAGRAARFANTAAGQLMCFSFKVKNNMSQGDHQYVVISSFAGGNSYASAWKYGTALGEGSYALKIVSGPTVAKKTYGTNGRSLQDAVLKSNASKYDWVLWGSVSVIDAGSFYLRDGSGVDVLVVAPNHGLSNTKYVSVKGTLDMSGVTPKVTNAQITKYN